MSSILIINPNSSVSITNRLKEILDPAPDFTYKFFTAPSTAPEEITNKTSEITSASVCLGALVPLLDQHDAFLIASYSDHPLIYTLKEHTRKPVLGIFQASVLHALAYGGERFAIITTTNVWKQALDDAILLMLGSHLRHVGTYPTGLEIVDFINHSTSMYKILSESAIKAVSNGAKTIILGCAAMSGMDSLIKDAVGDDIQVIDGVVAGTELLVGLIRSNQ
jgi:Asp/Glu/hydantoin racemase